ncbi:ATP-binding protein [Lentzea kentuckyensis]|uniref:ATP-binding protein n=1 Tax=Lentzea kentuckyensis TaxID=360086 RepID=UPI000A3A74B0|nr:tetratricopeptide repeat protein [Lentzea kentuckyensis]
MRIDALREALAARPGQPVSFDELIDAVWGAERPVNPKQALRNLVQRLRTTEQVVTEPSGYRLVLRKPGPRQLPAGLPDFVGRADEIARALDSTAPVLAITGPPGVGKTSLAIHVAHLLSERFPDGQLHVNLRAFAEDAAMTANQALHRFLRALGAEDVPVDLDAQSALFQKMTADRAVLVVIDNATRDLIGPLLPQGPGCRVIVTSRADLSEHEQIRLGVFEDDEAQELLARMRITGSPDDKGELVRLCAHLPLALRIAAAHVTDGHLVDYLADLRGDDRLDALEIEGDAAVNAAFDLSYRAQPVVAQRVFRLLGLVPGQDFGIGAVTALLGEPAGEPLQQLVDANLVQRNEDRYSLHDLLRMYAIRLGEAETARARLFDYYLVNAEAAARTINPEFARMPVPELPGDLPRHDFGSQEAAIEWFEAERGNIVAAIPHASPAPVAWLLADMLRGYFYFHSYKVDWFVAATAGLAAARAAGDDLAQAVMHGSIGLAHFASSQLPDALVEFGQARELLRRSPDDRMLVSVLINSGIAYRELGRLRDAAGVYTEALELQPDNSAATHNLGAIYLELGPLSAALANVDRTLELAEQQELPHVTLYALDARVEVLETSGRFEEAERVADQAAALRRQLPSSLAHESSFFVARATMALADRRYQEALDAFHKALAAAQAQDRQREQSDYYDSIGDAQRGLGDIDQALAAHGEGFAIAVKTSYLRGEVDNLAGLAADHHAAGELKEALNLARQARERAESGELRVRLVRVLVVLAGIHRALGDHTAADRTVQEAQALVDETECHLWDRELREAAV